MARVIVPVTRELLERAPARAPGGARGRVAVAAAAAESQGPSATVATAAGPARPPARRRIDLFEAGALARARGARARRARRLLVLKVWMRGGVVTGGDGFLVADPLQYLDWARQAGEHGLIGNLYDLAPGDRAFLHPGLLLSGWLSRLGAGPVAGVPDLEAGRRRRAVRGHAGARAALPGAPRRPPARARARAVRVLARRRARRLGRDRRCRGQAAVRLRHRRAVDGPTCGATCSRRSRSACCRSRCSPTSAAAKAAARAGSRRGGGAGCCALAAAVAGRDARVRARGRRGGAGAARSPRAGGGARSRRPLAATAAPLVYYALLARFDAAWELAGAVNDLPRWSWWVLLRRARCRSRSRPRSRTGCRRRTSAPSRCARGRSPAAARLLPAVRDVPVPRAPGPHAAARRARRCSRCARGSATARSGSWPAVGVVALLVVRRDRLPRVRASPTPSTSAASRSLLDGRRARRAALPRPRAEPGGVLAPVYTGIAVPAYTGRETWIGAGSWTPDQPARPRRPRRCSPAGSTRRGARRSCGGRARASC